ncbi:MAG: hypothetical protein BWZ10_02916 [candidate division BRC1 bacterium ADurb.BinA364]|nr:MAG: hypothetical protein BWZ10_02916 [candidate division BRC1 bacterium ADurb.BinA364]
MGYDARLQDQVCAVNVEECYSEAHPMTRRECVEHRLQALEVPLIVGEMSATEHVAAWAVPFLCYAEAPTSFARFARPTQTIGKVLDAPIPIGEAFWDVALNEQLRVPLWQLAFNDAVVVTNRWNVPPNQYADRAAWEKENLFGILHNQMPTYTLDRAHWNEQRDMIVKSYRQVCEWTGQIAFDEMTSHRFLTEDKKAQRSDFSSGKSVIVNFGDAPYEAEDGRIVPARGFLAIQ